METLRCYTSKYILEVQDYIQILIDENRDMWDLMDKSIYHIRQYYQVK